MLDTILKTFRRCMPKKIFHFFQPAYHYLLAFAGAVIYRFPSRHIKIVAVTGTKGKTSTVECVNAMLEAAGKRTALASTLRFKIGASSKPNLMKMTMPGRFFMQRFLRHAVDAGCNYAVIEISSEAAAQYRHKFIALDTLIFTNLEPEHIESHGSYAKYVAAKLSIAKSLTHSPKPDTTIIVNTDNKEAPKFLAVPVRRKISYSMNDVSDVSLSEYGLSFAYTGVVMQSKLIGAFNIYNLLAAIKYAESEHISLAIVQKAIATLAEIKGRAEHVSVSSQQPFQVIVDYAHTPDSLTAIYKAFPEKNIIGVLGATGGGRDLWKRKEMAEIAEKYCAVVILTDEDPYDDDPQSIVENLAQYFSKKPEIIMSRREAIRKALSLATKNHVVIITGKGTDPYIMRANGAKEPWSDAGVAREELSKIYA